MPLGGVWEASMHFEQRVLRLKASKNIVLLSCWKRHRVIFPLEQRVLVLIVSIVIRSLFFFSPLLKITI
jgi:hypothetical protein